MPFKVFVLASGVFGFPYARFAVTLLLARGARYSFWAGMGMAYGGEALRILRAFDHWAAERFPLLLGGALLALLIGLVVARRRRAEADVGGVS